jgi:hypothetical protein
MQNLIANLIIGSLGFTIGASIVDNKMQKKLAEEKKVNLKNVCIMQMLNRWIRNNNEGKNIAEYLLANGYKQVAIYGLSFCR